MADTVRKRGTDSSGRPILATDRMWDWWLAVVDELGFTPTIVQGAFMSRVPGGGASDSAGYHDLGGCFDLRVWDLTNAQCDQLVRTLREWGAAAWRRDQRHGMDPHIHLVLGADRPWTSGAASQWNAYLSGRDGLASNGADYEWRPTPLVLRPPEVDDMPWTKQELADLIDERIEASWQKKLGNNVTRETNLRKAGDAKEIARELKKELGK